MNIIYADNAATTRVSEEVLNAMLPYFREEYGNPSSVYSIGRNARRAIGQARGKVAKAIGAESSEIYFTSGGSESNNTAIKSILRNPTKKHIITSAIEHKSVLNSCKYLESKGFEVTYIPVDKQGFVNPTDVYGAIRKDTALVSIMTVNNEIGTVQPVSEIGKICRENGVLFHTDAVQAVGHIEIDVNKMNVDMLSISGHKIHAPKGIGVLYIRNGTRVQPLIHGGGQERDVRAGTENVPYIVGIGTAIENAVKRLQNADIVKDKRDKLINELCKIKGAEINGSLTNRVNNNINISFEDVDGETLSLMLDSYGICVSNGSACNTGYIESSYVIKAMGLSEKRARNAVRITLDETITDEEISCIADSVRESVEVLRKLDKK